MSIYAVPVEATHLAILTIEFDDDGEPDTSLVGAGTFEECDAIARTLPAISYSGDRKTKGASVGVYPRTPDEG